MPGSSPFLPFSTLVVYTMIAALTFNSCHLKVVYDPPSPIVATATAVATATTHDVLESATATRNDKSIIPISSSIPIATSIATSIPISISNPTPNRSEHEHEQEHEQESPPTSSSTRSTNDNDTNDAVAADAPVPTDNNDNDTDNNNDTDTDTSIDWTDSIFRRDGFGWDNDPIVIESHKLLFFTVPKNACSTFKQLFRRMMGHADWLEANPHNPSDNGLRYLGHYDRDRQREFMTSPEWTRAIFVRDPLERALSAYMDKGLKTGPREWHPVVNGHHMKHKCCRQQSNPPIPECHRFPLVPFETDLTPDNFPFHRFVASFMAGCDDPHWRPQHLRMHRTNWKWINFVGHFETKQRDARRLLEAIGAYDEFGATGWGESKSRTATDTATDTATTTTTTTTTTTSLSMFEKNMANHKTGSGEKMNDHYSTKTERLVLQHYRLDYSSEVFNLTKPAEYTQKLFGRRKKREREQ